MLTNKLSRRQTAARLIRALAAMEIVAQMKGNWINGHLWIAHFDILGFKSLLENDGNSIAIEIVKSQIDEILGELSRDVSGFEEKIGYLFFADTFIIYSKSENINEYPALINASKNFISRCINKKLPIRGAISYGDVVLGHDSKILMGKAFLESHNYGEDQNWIGLILTPSASKELVKNGIYPVRHGFINSDIPLRKCKEFSEHVYAYCFINGSANYKCPLLSPLEQMMQDAPDRQKSKYTNTIEFINKYYKTSKSNYKNLKRD